MKNAARILIAAALLAGLAGSRQVTAAGSSADAFAQLKTLVGHWEEQKVSENKPTLDIELTAGGTTLLEKFRMVEQGKPVEMITMYYLDGDQVKLTHYCMAGNQPTMRGTYAPETKTLTFDFERASNLKSANDGHMHHAVYKFIDNDHFQTTWTFQKDQKDAFTEDVIYVRK
ncbi:MAG TPA: hypothetical protein VNY81_02175 [Candidatus Saccharimonadales bacterium]|jgi:hypothetical protein|nr:hypothetical protein [Candidatus Saccharimonadales bacterium]